LCWPDENCCNDACIFIDVIELQLTGRFFGLNLDIHTTADVLNELYPAQQQILEGYKSSNKLTVHVLSGEEQASLMTEDNPKALTPEDRSVVLIAKKLVDAVILSSDKPVRNHAKKLCIEYHGMLWIFRSARGSRACNKAGGNYKNHHFSQFQSHL
jgi:hypothetical protein